MAEPLSPDEREKLRGLIAHAPFLGQHGEQICDLAERLLADQDRAIAAAVEAEREACAEIAEYVRATADEKSRTAETHPLRYHERELYEAGEDTAELIRDAIRARAGKETP